MFKKRGTENPGHKNRSVSGLLKKLFRREAEDPNPAIEIQEELERASKPFRIRIKEITVDSQTSDVLLSCPIPNRFTDETRLNLNEVESDEVEMKIEEFIIEAWAAGRKTLKIITGKTRLRDTAMQKMEQLKKTLFEEAAQKGERLVVFPKWERIRKRKSEAIIVYLVSIKTPAFESAENPV